jgi:hypothetical protein
MGIFVELSYFCITQYVFKGRDVCKIDREFLSFFPPPKLASIKRLVGRRTARLECDKGGWS